MEAYSLDLRQRICAACDEGDAVAEVAEEFGVGRWFVHKLLRQRRQDGSIAPRPRGRGPAPRLGPADRKRIREWVDDEPDATLSELCDRLREARGPTVSVPTMCRTLEMLRLPLKKRRCTRPSGTRPGSVRCADTSRNASRRWTPRPWSSWTRAGSTPP